MKKRLISFLLVLAMVFTVGGCGMGNGEQGNPGVTFTDDCGRSVEVPADISRIVPSGPLAQMILLALAPDMLVGIASRWNSSGEGIIPAEYYELPYLGRLTDSADGNLETLALADPQIIIDIGEKKDGMAEDLDRIQTQTGIPAVFVSATLESMPDTFRKLGKLLNRQGRAEELAQFCERTYARTETVMEQVGENKVNALYILGEEGLNVIARDSYHSQVLDMLTNNLAVVDNPSSKGLGNEVSMEQIALWDPEFILFAPGSIYGTVSQQTVWKDITAVKNGAYAEVPDGPYNWLGNPPGVQRYLSLIWLPAVLYPTYCDYDVKAEIVSFYELFYGCHLSHGQYDALTQNSFLGG